MRRNSQKMYPYLEGEHGHHIFQPFDSTDPTYTTEDLPSANSRKRTNWFTLSWNMYSKTARHDTNNTNRPWTTVVFTLTIRNREELASFIQRIPKNWYSTIAKSSDINFSLKHATITHVSGEKCLEFNEWLEKQMLIMHQIWGTHKWTMH